MKRIKSYSEYLKESLIPYLNNDVIFNKEIEGRFLNKKESEALQKEIEDNYIDGDISQHFNREKDDIRMRIFNYDNPIAQKFINGVDIRIVEGLIRDKRKTYLVYMNGRIVGEFYSVQDIKDIFKYIESQLVKELPK